MVVEHDAWFLCALESSFHNFLSHIGRHLAVWDLVAQEHVVSWLDHVQHVLLPRVKPLRLRAVVVARPDASVACV